jgi:chromosome segregation ATPase
MNENKDQYKVLEEISAKINTKRVATEKKRAKPDSLAEQIEMYEQSIKSHEEKIVKLKDLIAKREASKLVAQEELDQNLSEVEHMEEIYERYMLGIAESEVCSTIMVDRINELADWYPGIPEEETRKWERDPEYIEAKERQEYLNRLLPACLTDIQRIFYSRGDVSEFNVKGRKGV